MVEALEAVRDALQVHARDGSGLTHLQSPIRVLCDLARHDSVPPEQLLVQLKHTLSGVHELDELGPGKCDAIRNRIVQIAIESYFSDVD